MLNNILKGWLALTVSLLLFSCYHKKSNAIYQSEAYTIYPDSIVQHKFTARILSDHEIHSDYKTEAVTVKRSLNGEEKHIGSSWKLSKDIAAFPQYVSDYPVSNALYNMALEEMINAVEPDSTFRTGKEWAGVWTRDISYSIILSMAALQPQVARYSLLRKVNEKKRIIQDTGTGGAWPVSSDRMIWAVAAWELYKVTGDEDWLKESFVIIKNSLDDDLNTLYDPQTGMVKGESSFLDWREQTYPEWMQPADIFESENLGTNAVHYEANSVLSRMASLLQDTASAAKYKQIADNIKAGINRYLWMPDHKYYAQYLYGRQQKIRSPRSEALGAALCVLFNIADSAQQRQLIANTPVTDYGIPCIYPQIPGIPPYHNNAVWPFVQSFWLWAAAKTANEKMVMESISAIYRPAALFVTNKENFVADNGDYSGTEINSSNMLWSLAGNISIVHKVLFGINFQEAGVSFHPYVPESLKGNRRLTHYKYRNMVLDIELEGYGNRIKSFSLDGKPMREAKIPATVTGAHAVKIILANEPVPDQPINKTAKHTSPETPRATLLEDRLNWQPVAGAAKYKIIGNGEVKATITTPHYTVNDTTFAAYQVIAVDESGYESFASEPLVSLKNTQVKIYELERFAGAAHYPYPGFSGTGFSEISRSRNKQISIPITIDQDGIYSIDFRYANGNGPINTENKCAIRSLKIDNLSAGTFVFPQRGKEVWDNWGFSNTLRTSLTKGPHTLVLSFEPWNENMNGAVNQAMLDYIRIIRVD